MSPPKHTSPYSRACLSRNGGTGSPCTRPRQSCPSNPVTYVTHVAFVAYVTNVTSIVPEQSHLTGSTAQWREIPCPPPATSVMPSPVTYVTPVTREIPCPPTSTRPTNRRGLSFSAVRCSIAAQSKRKTHTATTSTLHLVVHHELDNIEKSPWLPAALVVSHPVEHRLELLRSRFSPDREQLGRS